MWFFERVRDTSHASNVAHQRRICFPLYPDERNELLDAIANRQNILEEKKRDDLPCRIKAVIATVESANAKNKTKNKQQSDEASHLAHLKEVMALIEKDKNSYIQKWLIFLDNHAQLSREKLLALVDKDEEYSHIRALLAEAEQDKEFSAEELLLFIIANDKELHENNHYRRHSRILYAAVLCCMQMLKDNQPFSLLSQESLLVIQLKRALNYNELKEKYDEPKFKKLMFEEYQQFLLEKRSALTAGNCNDMQHNVLHETSKKKRFFERVLDALVEIINSLTCGLFSKKNFKI